MANYAVVIEGTRKTGERVRIRGTRTFSDITERAWKAAIERVYNEAYLPAGAHHRHLLSTVRAGTNRYRCQFGYETGGGEILDELVEVSLEPA